MDNIFERRFPGVRQMLDDEHEQANAKAAAENKPFRLMTLNVGRPEPMSSHDTREEAQAALDAVLRTCAPFIRDAFWIEPR